jgi:SAM-dependent methyltransferase
MSQDYFVRRELPASASYEETYWGVITDPDGNVRDRRQERERYLADMQAELSFINALPVGRMLDVGCGLGFLLSGIKAGWERHGVEISAFAAGHAEHQGHIFQGRLEDAAYPDELFDLVVLYHVIEHVLDPLALLKEIRRVLKPSGWLLLGTPDFDSGAARRFGTNYRLLHDITHISLFSNESMHRFLRDHGFRIERVDYPYFETRHFNAASLQALFDTSRISPPFYGNFMTFYCRREVLPELKEKAQGLSIYLSDHGEAIRTFQKDCTKALIAQLKHGLPPRFQGEGTLRPVAMSLADKLAPSGINARHRTPTLRKTATVRLAWGQGTLQVTLQAPGSTAQTLALECPQDILLLTLLFEDIAERVSSSVPA